LAPETRQRRKGRTRSQARELERLRRQNERLLKRNEQLEKIVEIQGKMQALLQQLGSKETAPPSEPSRGKQ
jgi:hypothetical protein